MTPPLPERSAAMDVGGEALKSMEPAKSDIVLERLNRLHPKIIDLGLERVEDLLARLGQPQLKVPPVVHVAGTNGKGSTIAYLRAMLEAGGRRVHCYTSPHLVRFHERIRLDGDLIEERELVRLLERCEAANDKRNITYFEITTVAAFLAFAERPADVLLLETGLGGRLDATNVIPSPLLGVITPISLDHTQFLGESLAEIAFEKAGILKTGRPAVIGRQEKVALDVIEDRAKALGAPLFRHGREWDYALKGESVIYEDAEGSLELPKPRLMGAHQIENAALAVAAARNLQDLRLEKESIAKGLLTVEWPARLQPLTQGPIVDLLAENSSGAWELWLDGGHNEAAGERLSEALGEWGDKPIHLVYGMMNTKAAERYLAPLAKRASSLRAVTIPGEVNALSAEEAALAAKSAGFKAKPQESVIAACRDIVAIEPAGRILICGSLYLAGKVLAEHA